MKYNYLATFADSKTDLSFVLFLGIDYSLLID